MILSTASRFCLSLLLAAVLLAFSTAPLAQETYVVTVVTKTAAHPYFGQGEPEGYAINGVEGMELTLERGQTYNFQMSEVHPMHPFYISTSSSGGSAGVWNDGVTGNFASGDAVLTFAVPEDAPDELWYQCAGHLFMGYRINIVGGAEEYAAVMTGGSEVPANASRASGVLEAALSGNTLTVTGSFENLHSAFTGAHLHLGYAGRNGGIAIGLTPTLSGDQLSGTFDAEENTFELTPEHAAALAERRLYVNVHSTTWPGGEIRGQVIPAGAAGYHAVMTGRAEIPANEHPGAGTVVAELSGDVLTLSGSFANLGSDFNPEIGAHIHIGDLHQNGGVVIPLVVEADAELRSGIFSSDANTFDLTPEQVTALETGQWYVNVHTQDFPAGEIRGQLVPLGTQTFEVRMLGDHETPPLSSDASGAAILRLDGQTLSVGGAFSGIQSGYTAAHIHIGGVGTSGGVVFGLTPGLDAEATSGTFAPGDNQFELSADQLDDLWEGRYYINVHSNEHPPGEIRGQIVVAANLAPGAPEITEPADGATITVEGDPSKTLMVAWDAADPNANPLAFTWQLATDEAFETVVLEAHVTAPSVDFTYEEVDALLASLGLEVGQAVTAYHRAIASDGGLLTEGDAASITLARGAVVDGEPGATPMSFAVTGPAPNPFRGRAVLSVDLPEAAEVVVTVFDVLGRRVMVEVVGSLPEGAAQTVEIDSSSLAAGTYVYRVDARAATGAHTATGRFVRIP